MGTLAFYGSHIAGPEERELARWIYHSNAVGRKRATYLCCVRDLSFQQKTTLFSGDKISFAKTFNFYYLRIDPLFSSERLAPFEQNQSLPPLETDRFRRFVAPKLMIDAPTSSRTSPFLVAVGFSSSSCPLSPINYR